jgi:hypothetical protein
VEKPDPKLIEDLFKTLQSFELFPGDQENWTVELVDESDPAGAIVFKDAEGNPKMWMPQDVYWRFLEHHKLKKAAIATELVELRFHQPTDDNELTCFICGRFACDQEAVVYTTTRQGQKARTAYGKHSDCKISQVKMGGG